jgi:biopolymer transport protein ExbD
MAMKGDQNMNQIATNAWGRLWRCAGSVTFVVFVTMLFTAPRCTAQALKQGISVQLAVTHNAAAMPDADKEEVAILVVTQTGKVYFGVDPITPAALGEKQGLSSRAKEKLYIKADARTPYADVAKVLDALHKAGVKAPSLLTAQHETPTPGKLVSPKGLEVLLGPPLPSGKGLTFVQVLNSGQQWPLLKINNKEIPWANLESQLRQLSDTPGEKMVLLRANGKLPFGNVVQVMTRAVRRERKSFLSRQQLSVNSACASAACLRRKACS